MRGGKGRSGWRNGPVVKKTGSYRELVSDFQHPYNGSVTPVPEDPTPSSVIPGMPRVHTHIKKKKVCAWWGRCGEIAQWLKALSAFTEDLDFIPRTHMGAYRSL